jgi:CheY-like chemotaxis protein
VTRGREVLVVEDDRDVREALEALLGEERFIVRTARHGREALDRLLAGLRPSAILLDLRMPVMDGFEFCARKVADPALAPIPVVVISADHGAAARIAPLCAAAYLPKPIDVDALLGILERLLGG